MKPTRQGIVPLSILVGMVFGFQADAPADIYRYDPAGRLIKVAYDDGSGISYTYDKSGNLLLVERREVASDLNANGRVEMADWARFQICFTGEGGGSVTPECESADLNGDGTVDLDDFAQLHGSMNGPR